MSDTDGGLQPVDFGEPTQSDTDTSATEVQPDLSLGNPFIAKIPEQDRAIVAKYVKDWDAQVTKKFQEYSSKLKPYEALGPVEDLTKVNNLAQYLRADPEGFFRMMWNGFQEQYGDDFEGNLQRILELEEAMSEQNEQEDLSQGVGTPDPSEVFQQNVSSELEELRTWKSQLEQEKIQAEQNRQLDSLLSTMHTKHGDFNEDFVLTRLAAHGNPEQAIKEWNDMLGKYSQGPKRPVPKVPGSPGGVPTGQVKVSELRGQQRRDYVNQMLSAIDQ